MQGNICNLWRGYGQASSRSRGDHTLYSPYKHMLRRASAVLFVRASTSRLVRCTDGIFWGPNPNLKIDRNNYREIFPMAAYDETYSICPGVPSANGG